MFGSCTVLEYLVANCVRYYTTIRCQSNDDGWGAMATTYPPPPYSYTYAQILC